jgi:hypothetical protein
MQMRALKTAFIYTRGVMRVSLFCSFVCYPEKVFSFVFITEQAKFSGSGNARISAKDFIFPWDI